MPLTPDQHLCLIAAAPFLAMGAMWWLGRTLLAAVDCLLGGRS